jgi:hypothetical protein
MIKTDVIIYERIDLIVHSKNKDISEIKYCDFRISNEIFNKASIVLFVDDNGRTKILKNRYGNIDR